MSEIQQEIRYGGSNFSIEGVRKYTKEGFLERNLPLLFLMPDVPTEDKEAELIALWELCGQMLGVEKPAEEENNETTDLLNNLLNKEQTEDDSNALPEQH